MSVPVSLRLAEFGAQATFGVLPVDVVDRTKYLFLDYMGVAVRGSLSGSSRPIVELAGLLKQGAAGAGLGAGKAVSFPYDALANGTAAHSLELDDTHQAGSIHLGVSIFSTALALAAHMGCSGKRFLNAAVVGFEVAARVAMAVNPSDHYARGFHPTATCGAFGAAACAANLLGLDTQQVLWALGIAGSQAAGSMEFLADGAWTKRLHPGWAAFSGIHAGLLAQRNFVGPGAILEGRDGFFKAYGKKTVAEKITEGLGEDYQVMETAVKPHACCRYTQAPIDAILQVTKSHDVTPELIDKVEVGVLETGIPVICEPWSKKIRPQNVVEAQFSLPFGIAVALVKRSAGLNEFAEDRLGDKAISDMMSRVHYESDPALEMNYPREWPAWVHVALKDGNEFSANVRFPKGDPENPLSWQEVAEKYTGLVAPLWSARHTARVFEAVKELELQTNMRRFVELAQSE